MLALRPPLQDPDGDDLFTTVAAGLRRGDPARPALRPGQHVDHRRQRPGPLRGRGRGGESEAGRRCRRGRSGAGPDDVGRTAVPRRGAREGGRWIPESGSGFAGFQRGRTVVRPTSSRSRFLLDDVVEPGAPRGTLFSGRTNGRAAVQHAVRSGGPVRSSGRVAAGPHRGWATGPQLPPPFPDPTPVVRPRGTAPPPPPVPDAHGLAAAISRLRPGRPRLPRSRSGVRGPARPRRGGAGGCHRSDARPRRGGGPDQPARHGGERTPLA